MITGKKLIVLANVETVQDEDTGERRKEVTFAKKLIETVELVGVQTATLGQAQGFNLSFSVEVWRIHYNSEKYLYFSGRVYEIKSMTKAKDPAKMLLNVQAYDDDKTKSAIERWLGK